MELRDVPAWLDHYTDFERIYKKRYGLLQQPAALASYLRTLTMEYLRENEILLPEKLIPRFRLENGDIYQNEPLTFFRHAPMRCKIEKHPRYLAEFWHNHALFEILYVYRGSCQNDFPGQHLILREHDVCFIAPRINHRIGVFDDSLLINIQVSPEVFSDFFLPYLQRHEEISQFFIRALQYDSYHPYLLFTDVETHADSMQNYVEHAILEQVNSDAFWEDALCADFILFFTALQRAKKNVFLAKMTKDNEKKFGAIAETIRKDFRHLTLQELADRFHYSVPYLSRLIKKNTGTTFVRAVQELRLQYAAEQLERTNRPIGDIADDCGYEGSEHFIRIFRKQFGTTPLQYRKHHQSKEHNIPLPRL